MSSGMKSIIFSLLASLSWGGSEFFGGLAGRHTNTLLVTIGTEFLGLVPISVLLLVLKEPFLTFSGALWASLAGVSGAASLIALYTALSRGKMAIVAPVAGIVAAALTTLAGIGVNGPPTKLQVIGFGVALVGLWILSSPKVNGVKFESLLLPVIAGLTGAIFFITIREASRTSVLWPNFIERAVAVPLVIALAAFSHQKIDFRAIPLKLIIPSGLLDTGGALLFTMAVRSGRLDVSAVLISLYPGCTAVLSWAVLRERISRSQWLGIVIALVAVAMISL